MHHHDLKSGILSKNSQRVRKKEKSVFNGKNHV